MSCFPLCRAQRRIRRLQERENLFDKCFPRRLLPEDEMILTFERTNRAPGIPAAIVRPASNGTEASPRLGASFGGDRIAQRPDMRDLDLDLVTIAKPFR